MYTDFKMSSVARKQKPETVFDKSLPSKAKPEVVADRILNAIARVTVWHGFS